MSTGAEPIICRATPWYHKRRIAMLIMVFGLSAWFTYDWQVKYPREYAAQREFIRLNTVAGLEKGSAAYDKGTPEYAALAKEKGWPEKPDLEKNFEFAITWEQPISAILTGVAGLAMLYFYIRTSRGTLSADETSFSTPDGQHVPFASAFKIDRRKWDHKGLAYVYYKNENGKEGRAVIDDLIFGGAVKVLERLQVNFKGSIIDLEKAEEPEAPATAAEKEPEKEEKDSKEPETTPAS